MIVVTGTRRSGTSMWMQILRAAGYSIIGDAFPGNWKDTIGEANPHGFYESILRHGIYYKTNPHPVTGEYVLPEEVTLHVVKVFIPGVVRSDRGYLHRVLATVRPWREYVASVQRMQAMEAAAHGRAQDPPPSLPPALEWWEANFKLVGDIALRRYACHVQAYDDILESPRPVIEKVLAWLGGGGDVDAATAAVRPQARTQRTPTDPAIEASIEPDYARVFDDYYAAVRSGAGLDAPLIQRMNETHAALQPRLEEHKLRIAKALGLPVPGMVGEGPFARME